MRILAWEMLRGALLPIPPGRVTRGYATVVLDKVLDTMGKRVMTQVVKRPGSNIVCPTPRGQYYATFMRANWHRNLNSGRSSERISLIGQWLGPGDLRLVSCTTLSYGNWKQRELVR